MNVTCHQLIPMSISVPMLTAKMKKAVTSTSHSQLRLRSIIKSFSLLCVVGILGQNNGDI